MGNEMTKGTPMTSYSDMVGVSQIINKYSDQPVYTKGTPSYVQPHTTFIDTLRFHPGLSNKFNNQREHLNVL